MKAKKFKTVKFKTSLRVSCRSMDDQMYCMQAKAELDGRTTGSVDSFCRQILDNLLPQIGLGPIAYVNPFSRK